jgi:hypothetical protein
MGDIRRFDCMAKLIARQFSEYKERDIADVAGGKGFLREALQKIGYRRVNVIEESRRCKKSLPGDKWKRFRYDAKEKYSLVIGMHPDEATDHIVLYAVRNNVPFVVCPCCVKPSAVPFDQVNSHYARWCKHIANLAVKTHNIMELTLPITGPNTVLVGRPKH